MKTITIVLIFFTFSLLSQDTDSSKVKVTFLTQDVADGYDHRGGTPILLKSVEKYFKEKYKENYIKYDLTKLMKNDVKPYYIFNKKYCTPIEKVLGANTFVMTRLEIIKPAEKYIFEDIYKVYVKVYSSLSGKSEIIYKNDNVKSDTLETIFDDKEKVIVDKIFKVAKVN